MNTRRDVDNQASDPASSGAPLEPAAFKAALVDAAPRLRAFARSLTGNFERADDLVQETIARAIENRKRFAAGTNMRAWLTTILRNQYFTEIRKRRREVEDADGAHAALAEVAPQQNTHLEMRDMLRALQMLQHEQREALLLIAAADFSYDEAAEIVGVAVGTIKSRVSRARAQLEIVLSSAAPLPGEAASVRSVKEIDAVMALHRRR